MGTQLTAVAIGIQIYEITASTAAVALVGALALAPMLVMGVVGGTVVDAFDRRRVLIAASTVSFIAPVGIAALAWFDVTELWGYYTLTTLSSTVGALVGAARFAIHPRLVRRELLPAVAALSGVSAGVQSAFGPALAGILVASVGYAWTYSIDVALFVVGFWGIIALPAIMPERAVRVGWRALRDGFTFVRRAANLRTAIAVQIAVLTLGRPYALLPAVAALLVGGGAVSVGVLTASAAVGVIISGLFSGRLGGVRHHGRAILVATVVFGGVVAVFGVMLLVLSLGADGPPAKVQLPALLALALALVVAGAADNVAGIFRTTMMQSATPDEVRGRLQGIFTLVLTAGPRLGDVYAGFLAAAVVLWLPPVLGGGAILLIAAALFFLRPAFRAYDGTNPVA